MSGKYCAQGFVVRLWHRSNSPTTPRANQGRTCGDGTAFSMKQQEGTATPSPSPPSSLDIIIALARSFWLPWIKKTHYQSSANLAREQNATSSNCDQRSNPDYLICVSTWWSSGQCAKCWFFFVFFNVCDLWNLRHFPLLVPLFSHFSLFRNSV